MLGDQFYEASPLERLELKPSLSHNKLSEAKDFTIIPLPVKMHTGALQK